MSLCHGGVTFFAPAAARSTLDRRIYHAKNKMGIYRFYGQFIPYYLTVYCPHGAAGAAASGRPAGAGGIPDALPPCGWYDGVGLLLRDAPMCAGHAAPGSARSRGSCRSSHRAFAAAGCSAPPRRHTGRSRPARSSPLRSQEKPSDLPSGIRGKPRHRALHQHNTSRFQCRVKLTAYRRHGSDAGSIKQRKDEEADGRAR